MEKKNLLGKLFVEIEKEIEESNISFTWFNSTHEGYGVIKEEFDELWDEIKGTKNVYDITDKMEKEAIQLAAMAIKFILSLEIKNE